MSETLRPNLRYFAWIVIQRPSVMILIYATVSIGLTQGSFNLRGRGIMSYVYTFGKVGC